MSIRMHGDVGAYSLLPCPFSMVMCNRISLAR